jgi:hypothetical protein
VIKGVRGTGLAEPDDACFRLREQLTEGGHVALRPISIALVAISAVTQAAQDGSSLGADENVLRGELSMDDADVV